MSAAQCLVAIALLAGGCATGGKGGDGPIDAPKPLDSSQVTVDAPKLIDAPMQVIDAPIDAMIDAPTSGGVCNGNNECGFPGECCLTLGGPGICVPGTAVGSLCLPD